MAKKYNVTITTTYTVKANGVGEVYDLIDAYEEGITRGGVKFLDQDWKIEEDK